MKSNRNTVAKTTIFDVLKKSKIALSHSEIQSKTNGICDRVTIYRVLERLYLEEKVHKTVGIDGVIKYAVCHHDTNHNHYHIHFNCEKCLRTICLENVSPEIKLPDEYFVKDVNFTIVGLCPSCK